MQWNVTSDSGNVTTGNSTEEGEGKASEAEVFTLVFDVPEGTKGVVRLPVVGNTTLDGTAVSVGDDGVLESEGGAHVVVVQTL